MRARTHHYDVSIFYISERSFIIKVENASESSIGANIHEANYSSSKAELITKMQNALKK